MEDVHHLYRVVHGSNGNYLVVLPWTKNRTVSIIQILPYNKYTNQLQLEELDDIFEAPNPVKKSLEKKQVLVSEQHGVAVIEKVVA